MVSISHTYVHSYNGYKATNERPEERSTLTEKVIINDVNLKLIEMYETS